MADFYVDSYGAVGNCVVDDTLKIQDAINACHAAGGGRVIFGTGKCYRIGRQAYFDQDIDGTPYQIWWCLKTYSNIEFYSADPNNKATLELLDNAALANQYLRMIINDTVDANWGYNVKFTNLIIDGNRNNQPEPTRTVYWEAIRIDNRDGFAANYLVVRKWGEPPATYHDLEHFGLEIVGGHSTPGAVIMNCSFHNGSGSGLAINGFPNSRVQPKIWYCTSYDNKKMGYAMSEVDGIDCYQCEAHHCGNGCNDELGVNNTWNEVYSHDNTGMGGRTGGHYGRNYCDNVRFINSTFERNGDGIKIENTASDDDPNADHNGWAVEVSGCTIRDNQNYGIKIQDGFLCAHLLCTGNTFSGNIVGNMSRCAKRCT